MDWFLYDKDLRHKRVKMEVFPSKNFMIDVWQGTKYTFEPVQI